MADDPEPEDVDERPRGILMLLSVCCCLNRRKAPEAETLDIYVTSDTSRLLGDGSTEDYKPPADYTSEAVDGKEAAAKECAGVSVKERTNVLRGRRRARGDDAGGRVQLRREVAGEAAPPPRKNKAWSAAASKLATKKSEVACGFCGLAVPSSEAASHRGLSFHPSCFRCGSCGKSLVGVQHGTLDDDDLLLCDEASAARRTVSCLARAREKAHRAGAAKEAANQRPSETDLTVARTAKEQAIEIIGDDLERIVRGMAPTCALCGGPFGPKDKLFIQGMALKSAPATLILKLRPKATGRTATFFLARSERQPDANGVIFAPDADARGRRARRRRAGGRRGAPAVGELGAVLAEDVATLDGASLAGALAWSSAGLVWRLACDFAHDAAAGTIRATSARLSVDDPEL
ncbi:ATP-dependent DNA helicase [Aureococcus anophagefferens]|nr:ATP-dependent DNA helicase [Aureococcus anophagefferens]